MLFDYDDLKDCGISATDGEIGTLDDLFFDDHAWTVRYLIVDTGQWLRARKVLLSPASVRGIHPQRPAIAVELTRRQVEESPDIDTQRPVSRQAEEELSRHYGFAYYPRNLS